jgi:hypothetical protein
MSDLNVTVNTVTQKTVVNSPIAQRVVEVNRFGAGGSSVDTGILTGAFYPLVGNPSGFSSGINTSNFVTTGQTGSFITTGQTGIYASTAYVNANFLRLGQTSSNVSVNFTDNFAGGPVGVFSFLQGDHYYLQDSGQTKLIDVYNGIISGFNLVDTGNFLNIFTTGSVVRPSQTGQFITTGQTGQFYPSNNPSKFIDKTSGDSFYYPLSTNPSGYVQSSQTGSFVTTGQTGSFIVTGNTGIFATVSYVNSRFLYSGPTTSNPSVAFTDNIAGITTFSFVQGSHYYLQDSGRTKLIDIYSGIISGFNLVDTGVLINSFVTGLVVRPNQTGNFADKTYVSNVSGALDSRLQSTGSFLYNLIQASSAGVAALNGLSGTLTLTGAGNVVVSSTGQVITVSGATGSFVTTGQTGNFITTSQTGGFVGVNQTGSFATTGFVNSNYYPLNSNPSGYVLSSQTGVFITTGQTGQFYPTSNPSNYITSFQTGGFVGTNQTGNFITTGQTGQFYAASNPSSFITKTQGDTFYYPLSSNPSGYVLSSQTGNFITSSQTGSFITTGQTGLFAAAAQTGIFITTGQTGQFYPTSNPNGYITSAQIGVASINVTGLSLTGNLTFTGINGILLSSGNSSTIRFDGSNFALNSQTGNFITTSQTGGFVGTNQTGSFATTGFVNSNYYPLNSNPSGYVQSSQTGAFITTGQTGSFVGTSQTGNFITTGQTGNFVNVNQTGAFATTGFVNANYYPLNSNPSGYITTSQTGSFVTSASNLNSSGSGIFVSKVGSDLQFKSLFTGSGIFITTSGNALILSTDTGVLLLRSESGQFYAASNPSNYVTATQTGTTLVGKNQTGVLLTGSGILISGNGTSITISTNTGFLLPRSESGYFASKSYVDNTFSTVQVTGSSTILAPNFTGGGAVSVSVIGNTVTIFGTANTGTGITNSSADVTGISVNAGSPVTGLVDFQAAGNVTVSIAGNTITYSGSVPSGIAVSGETYKSTLYIETPTSSENINWFYNPQPISLKRVLTSYDGSAGSLGWTISQTTDTSLTPSLIITGLTDSNTTGNYLTGFTNSNLSGNVFVIFKTQSLAGTVNSTSLSLIGDNVLQLANPIFNSGNYVLKTDTGFFITTGQTGNFINNAINLGTGMGIFSGTTGQGVSGRNLNFYSLSAGSGVALSLVSNTISINSTHGQSTGFSATGGNLTNAHQFYHVISGDVGSGVWWAASNVYLTTPPNQYVKVTAKLWDGVSGNPTVFSANERSIFSSGSTPVGTTGHLTVQLTDLIRFTGATNSVVISCAASLTGCIIKTLPMDYATGIGANVTSDLDLLKLI